MRRSHCSSGRNSCSPRSSPFAWARGSAWGRGFRSTGGFPSLGLRSGGGGGRRLGCWRIITLARGQDFGDRWRCLFLLPRASQRTPDAAFDLSEDQGQQQQANEIGLGTAERLNAYVADAALVAEEDGVNAKARRRRAHLDEQKDGPRAWPVSAEIHAHN